MGGNSNIPIWKGIYSKREEFAPNGSKFFPGAWCEEKQTESQTLSPLYKMAEVLSP